MEHIFTINYDVCLKLLIYCLLISCKVVVVVVKFMYYVRLWDAKYGHEEYQVVNRTNVNICFYILLIMCFYDWSIYNPTITCVLIYCIQCKNSQVLKATLFVLTCEVYFS